MKDVRMGAETAWNALFAIALLVIVASGWLLYQGRQGRLAMPSPSERDQLGQVGITIAKAKKATQAASAEIQSTQWTEDSETLGSSVLDDLTRMADKQGLQLSGFRTEKLVPVCGMREAPFMATVEGSYPDLIAFLRALEDPKAKLTVNLLEVKASDHGSGDVVATLGLVGFLPEAKA